MGVQTVSRTCFPNMSLTGLVLSRNIVRMCFANIQKSMVISAISHRILTFPRCLEYLCDCFTIMVLKWCEAMLHRSVIQTKTVTAGLCTFTMLVSKPIDHISFRQWVRTESFAWHIWNYMFHESPTAASQARRRRGDTQIGLHHKHHCPT